MPQPTGGDLLVSVPLGNISTAYMATFPTVSDKVFPVIGVDLPAGKYWKYNKGDWMKIQAKPRAAATESAGSGWSLDQGTFTVYVDAIHKDVDDQTRAQVGANNPGMDLDRDATQFVTRQLLMRREQKWVDAYFRTGLWGQDLAGVTGTPTYPQFKQWDQTGSTPIEDVYRETVRIAGVTGYKPNVLVVGPEVWSKLVNHAEIIDRVKYTQPGFIGEDIVARALGVERVLVSWGAVDSANEGAASSFAFQFGKSALLAYAPPNPGLMQPSAGYQFAWTGYLGASASGSRVKKFRMEPIASDRIEGEMAIDMAAVGTDLASFFASAIS